jgi:hypothetical protein
MSERSERLYYDAMADHDAVKWRVLQDSLEEEGNIEAAASAAKIAHTIEAETEAKGKLINLDAPGMVPTELHHTRKRLR